MLLLGDVYRYVCFKFLADGIGLRTVIVNNLAREQFV